MVSCPRLPAWWQCSGATSCSQGRPRDWFLWPTTGEVLASCFEISLAFVPDKPHPRGGFAACSAFNPDGPLAGRLRTEHAIAMRDLYYGTDEPPTFDEVLDRVQASRALLDIEIAS